MDNNNKSSDEIGDSSPMYARGIDFQMEDKYTVEASTQCSPALVNTNIFFDINFPAELILKAIIGAMIHTFNNISTEWDITGDECELVEITSNEEDQTVIIINLYGTLYTVVTSSTACEIEDVGTEIDLTLAIPEYPENSQSQKLLIIMAYKLAINLLIQKDKKD